MHLHFAVCKGKSSESVQCAVTGTCLRMHHRPSAQRTVPIQKICLCKYIVQFAMYRNIFSFIIFGDLVNYTFLETLGPTESEKQCLHFFQASYGSHLGFSKWRLFFPKSSNISASNHPRHMILVSKHTFLRSRNPVGQLRRC